MAAFVALGVVAVAVALFAIERIPVEVSALALVVLLVATGLLAPDEALAGFSSDTVIFIFALLAMTQGLDATGVMRAISERVVAVARFGPGAFRAALLAVVCAFSTVASNTAVTAAFLPVATSVAARTGVPVRRLLLPMAFSSMLGGTILLFGTSTNLVVSEAMRRLGLRPIGFAELAPAGLVLAVAGIAATLALARGLSPELPRRRGLDVGDRAYVTELVLGAGSPLVGKPVAEIEEAVRLPVLGVVRSGATFAPDPRRVLAADDRLVVGGSRDDVLEVEHVRAAVEGDGEPPRARGSRIVEAWIPPTSALLGRSVDVDRFARDRGVTVLGLHRHPALQRAHRREQRAGGAAGYAPLALGDVLLLRAPEERIRALADGLDVTLLGEVEHRPLRSRRALLAAAIFAAAIATAGLRLTSPAIAGLAGLLAMVATGCVDARTAFRVDWRVVILVASLLALGAAMEKSGAGELVAGRLIPLAKFAGPRGVLACVMLLTIALSVPMSNQAAALVVAPIAYHVALDLGLEPRPLLIGTCLAASCAFMTPLEPSAALVYGPGHYRFSDFLRIGTPVTLLMLVLLTALVPAVWPFRGADAAPSSPVSIRDVPVRRRVEAAGAGEYRHALPPTRGDRAMRVMVIVKATRNSEAGILPGDPRAPAGYDELFERMGKFNEELVKAGVMLAGDGLQPSSRGKRVVFSGGKRTVVDGPFAETKELVAGFWLWQVRSMDEALEWMRRCPDPMPGEESVIELRPLYEAEDLGAGFSPEERAREDRLRAEIERQRKG